MAAHAALAGARRRCPRGAFAVAVLVSLAVLFAPASDVPTAPPGVDKLVHASLFAASWRSPGGGPGIRRGRARRRRWSATRRSARWSRGSTPLDRSASVGDWLADVVGRRRRARACGRGWPAGGRRAADR